MKKIFLLLILTVYIFADTISDAGKLFENKQYEESLTIFKESKNSPEAQYYFGKAYLYGMGVNINKKKAFEYATKSANSKYPAGINLLGVLYANGDGVEKDELQALVYYKEAAKLGNTKAMMNIGEMYRQGGLIKKDSKEAMNWFKKAVEHGDTNGYCVSGNIYLFNLAEEGLALKNFLSCEKGSQNSIAPQILSNMGQIYKNKNNNKKAYEYFKKAATLDDIGAMIRLHLLLKKHQKLSTLKDEHLFWIKKAVKLNDMGAISRLYSYYYFDTKQYKKALQLANKAYKNGNIEMGCNLAEYYGVNIRSDYQQNPDVNYSQAFSIANKIIQNHPTDKNTANCYTALSSLYLFGIYTPKDLNRSIDFLKKSFENDEFKSDLRASRIADRYLEELEDYENAELWYKKAYELSEDEKYLHIVEQYKNTKPKYIENNTKLQQVFPVLDNFQSPQQIAVILESNKYYFMVTDQKSIKVFNKQTLELLKELRGWVGSGLEGIVSSMAFDEKNELLYCTPLYSMVDFSKNGTIVIFDIHSGKIVKTLKNKKALKVTSLSLSKDGKYLLVINRAEDFNIINTKTNETQSYSRFLANTHLHIGTIVKKDDDYIAYIMDSNKILWGYSVKEERQISQEPFNNQIKFNVFNQATPQAQAAVKKLFASRQNNFTQIAYKDKKLYLSEHNSSNVRYFSFNTLKFQPFKEKVNFTHKVSSKIEIKYANDYTTIEIYDKAFKKLLSSLDLLWTKPLRHLVIDDKYILVVTSDASQMLVFNLHGRVIANLSGTKALQVGLLHYKDGYLFSMGKDKVIHIWNLENLGQIDISKEVYDEEILKGFSSLAGGDPLEMLTETTDPKLLKQQAQQYKLSFIPTEKQLKFVMKTLFLKKEIIYPLASLYIKDNDWIISNKQGLFASSKNGKKLIKYTLNQGLYKESKIIENDQVFEKFYRPDLIRKILAKEKVDKQIDVRSIILNIKPPEVTIVDKVMKDKKNLELRYKICDAGNGVSNISLILNGIMGNLQNTRGFTIETRAPVKDKCTVYKNIITLQPGKNTISIKAFDKEQIIFNTSKEIVVHANYKIEKKPNLHLLTLAVSDYKDDALKLKYSVSDVLAVQDKMKQQGKELFDNIFTYSLHDQNMTKKKLVKIFNKISKNAKINDVFIMYIAGHGITKEGIYYFLPYDITDTTTQGLKKYAISVNDISDKLADIIVTKSLILLDTCGSGGFIDNSEDNSLSVRATIARLNHASKRNYIAASSSKKVALEGYENHGVFTYVVLDAFKKASVSDAELTIFDLGKKIIKDVPEISNKLFHYGQKPEMLLRDDFPIGASK